MMIGVAKANHYQDKYVTLTEQPIFPPERIHLEDPFIWQTDQGYELIAKDMDGRTGGEFHGGIHAYSKDGLAWELSSNPKAYSRSILWDDGNTRVMGSLERPFLLFQDGQPTHLFAATADGPGGFRHATKTWNMVIPLKTE